LKPLSQWSHGSSSSIFREADLLLPHDLLCRCSMNCEVDKWPITIW
jgi:hypothetical protein